MEITERLRPVAAPVDSYVRPAEAERSNLWAVAESLRGFDRELDGFARQRMAEAEETDKTRGEAAFYQGNASGFTEAVREGSIPSFASPGFMEGYKRAQGNVMGSQLVQAFQIDYMKWPGKNGTDPKAFEGFLSGWLSEKLQGVQDPEVLNGLLPHVRALQTGMQGQFYKDLDQNIYGGSVTAHAAGVAQSIQTADTDGRGRPTGTDYEGLWTRIVAQRAAALGTGMRSEDFDAVLVDTIVGEALQNRDPGLLNLLDRTLPGTTYKISDTPGGRKAKEAGLQRLEVLGRQALADQEHRDRKAAAEGKNRTERSVIDFILANPDAPIPDELLKEGAKYDGDFKVRVVGWQKTLREGGVAEDPRAVAELNSEILAGGGFAAVRKGIDNGTLRTAESIRAAAGFAKSMESEAGKAALKGPTFTGVMTAIKERTRDDRFVNPLDPNSGLSDAGIEGQVRYQRLLMEWIGKNPNASELDILKAQKDIGDQVLGAIQGEGFGTPKSIAPETTSKPASPTQQQAAPQGPQGQTNWWQAPVTAQKGESTADAAARKRWLDGLSPERLKTIEDGAAARGVQPQEQAIEIWKRMRAKGQQRSEMAPEDSRAMAYADAGQGLEDIIGAYLRPAEPAEGANLPSQGRPVAQQVMRAAQAAGLPPAAVAAIVWQESNFNPATRPISGGRVLSSATGLFQMLKGDRAQYAVPENASIEHQIAAGLQKTRANWDAAKAALGRDPTPAELYVVHYQGIGAGPAILKNPNASFVGTLNAWGRERGGGDWGVRVLRANPWLANIKTNGDFIRWAGRKIDPKVAALSSGNTAVASR
ncbi:MAG: hypothetical protein AB1698_01695 [Pseudomonadota bacterium]